MEFKNRSKMGMSARSIVVNQFSLDVMVDAYDRLFASLAQRHVQPGNHANGG